jgi:hypothetical protein
MKRRYPVTLVISTYTAFISGILIPLFETIKRWDEISEISYFLNWFDGYLIGGFLIFAAAKTLRSPSHGQRFLCAAWGVATGMAFMSLFRQLEQLDDVDQIESLKTVILVMKSLMLLVAFACMVMTVERYYIPSHLQDEENN